MKKIFKKKSELRREKLTAASEKTNVQKLQSDPAASAKTGLPPGMEEIVKPQVQYTSAYIIGP